jgi:hypothetical protein
MTQRNRERTLRHAAPERVRELLHAYRRRADRDRPAPRRGVGERRAPEPWRLGSDTSSAAEGHSGDRA